MFASRGLRVRVPLAPHLVNMVFLRLCSTATHHLQQQTLLHEAAHGVSDVRDVQDTSREGRHHNTRHNSLGEELDLTVTQVAGMGWSGTSAGGFWPSAMPPLDPHRPATPTHTSTRTVVSHPAAHASVRTPVRRRGRCPRRTWTGKPRDHVSSSADWQGEGDDDFMSGVGGRDVAAEGSRSVRQVTKVAWVSLDGHPRG
jgi:hypothetical protein